jgi:predicted RNA-binding Zn-ribbon protein involved in translation (DUF1610 family)
MAKFCSSCGTQLIDGQKFCTSCGAVQDGAVNNRPEKVGNVKKCPNCGAEVESFQTRCTSCGHELNQVGVSKGIQEFFNRYDALLSDKSGKAVRGSSSKIIHVLQIIAVAAGVFLTWIACYSWPYIFAQFLAPPVVAFAVAIALSFAIPMKWTENDEQRKEMLSTFPLPNTREDITEFLVLAANKYEKVFPLAFLFERGKYKLEWNKIWAGKIKQVYTKAKLSMSASDLESLKSIQAILREANIKV